MMWVLGNLHFSGFPQKFVSICMINNLFVLINIHFNHNSFLVSGKIVYLLWKKYFIYIRLPITRHSWDQVYAGKLKSLDNEKYIFIICLSDKLQ